VKSYSPFIGFLAQNNAFPNPESFEEKERVFLEIFSIQNKQRLIIEGHSSQVHWILNITRKARSFSLKLSRLSNE
jgi:hypothetical protein